MAYRVGIFRFVKLSTWPLGIAFFGALIVMGFIYVPDLVGDRLDTSLSSKVFMSGFLVTSLLVAGSISSEF